MGIVLTIIGLLSMVLGIGSLVCWVLVLIKIFQDEEQGGVGKGIFGIICGLYALIWGWQNHERHGNKNIVMAWTGIFIASIVLNVLSGVLAGAAAG